MSGSFRPTVAEISLPNLVHNFHLLKSCIQPGRFFCPMVKANAYGHGDIRVAQALEENGATHLGVALIEEGLRLRAAGLHLDILIFGILDSLRAAEAIVQENLTPVIGDFGALEWLDKVLQKRRIQNFKVHLEFNTGMNRLGFDPEEAAKAAVYLQSRPHFKLSGLCTHFFEGHTLGQAASSAQAQVARIASVYREFSLIPGADISLHALNSDAALVGEARAAFPDLGFRPGISLYGAEPFKAVMTLKTQVAAWHRIKSGGAVSYNATWKATRPSLIAVLPIGYGDGYMRNLSNRGLVLCRGERAPVVGTICMDYLMVDLTDVELSQGSLVPNESVVLWGEQGSAQLRGEEIARLAGTISYEIFTHVGERVPRMYKHVRESR